MPVPPQLSTRPIVVMKFGGSSLASASHMIRVMQLVRDCQAAGNQPVVVLSAMGQTTTHLIQAARQVVETEVVDFAKIRDLHVSAMAELGVADSVVADVSMLMKNCERVLEGLGLIGEMSHSSQDVVMSFGERMAVRIFEGLLNRNGLTAKHWDSFDLGFRTIGSHVGSAECERVDVQLVEGCCSEIRETLERDWQQGSYIAVVTGFIAKNEVNKICTLGRGGSDFTASIIGVALKANEIQIWTDTNGVLTADPRTVKATRCISNLTFEEASELAYFGAKILHPRSIQPAAKEGISVRVKNTYEATHAGTLISTAGQPTPTKQLVTALTLKQPVILVDIQANQMLGQFGFLAQVFAVFQQLRISVDVIATSEVSISITLDKDTQMERVHALTAALTHTAEVNVMGERGIVALIGNKNRAVEVLELASATLKKINVPLEMVSLGASKLNTSLVIRNEHSIASLQALHQAFFPSV